MYRLRNYYLRCLGVTQYLPFHTDTKIEKLGSNFDRNGQESHVTQNGTDKCRETKIGDLPHTSAEITGRDLKAGGFEKFKKEHSLTVKLAAQKINNLLIMCEVGDGLLSDSEIRLLKNILRSLEIRTNILNFEVAEFLNVPRTLDDKFFLSVLKQFSDEPDVKSGLILGLKNYQRIPLAADRSDDSINRFELSNGIKIAQISDLATMLREPEEKKRAWNILKSRPEIGQTAFN